MALTSTQIQNAYVAFFNRPADVAGLNYWSSYSGNAADLLNTFAQSSEYKALYANMNNTQVANAVYQNLFNKAADVAGLNYWVSQLDSGKVTIGNVADAISKGAQGTDAAIITNKVAAAEAFTKALDTTAEIVAYAGVNASGINSVKAWLNTVTSDAASVTTATGTAMNTVISGVQNTSSSGATGQTFTLTTGNDYADVAGSSRMNGTIADTFKFTSANESVTATTGTLAATDTLSDATTTDNDSLNLTLTNDTVLGSSITGIETVTITTTATTAGTTGGTAAADITWGTLSGVKNVVVTGASTVAVDIDNGGTAGFGGATNIDASGLTVAGINFDNSGVATGPATTVKGGNGANTIITAGGADNVTGGDAIDNITTNGGADVIVAGGGADVISAGAGADTITGGAGADAITGGTGVDVFIISAASESTSSNLDAIADFALGVGGDKLDLLGTPTVVSDRAVPVAINGDNFTIVNGVLVNAAGTTSGNLDSLAEIMTAFQTLVTTAGQVAAVDTTVGGQRSTFVFQENGATDTLIQLTGVAATSIGLTEIASGVLVA